MSGAALIFNPPPGWPKPPAGWQPPPGWTPDPSWPEPPAGWQLWIPGDGSGDATTDENEANGEPLLTRDNEGAQAEAQQVETPIASRIALLEAENSALRARLEQGGDDVEEIVVLDDEAVLQNVGIYRYHHPLENAPAYREQLDALNAEVAQLVKVDQAIKKSNMFTYDNSLAKGRKMTDDLAKLMLRAYNAEADNSIRTLRVGNVVTANKRLEASRTSIAKLGRMMEMHISDEFHALRLNEIELTADWLMKKEEEKEAAREERARLREEQRVQRELTEERSRLDKERSHIERALAGVRESGTDDPELQARLDAIDQAIAQNDFRAANIRAGYVYVISNRGSFGSNVVKIGLTRRLEPIERVSELSGASVPFRFDVHALFFSEDAVTLENQLHQHFASKALNHANPRKEFFFASPAEVREVLAEKVGNLLEFAEHVEATEYLQSLKYWPSTEDPASS